jgi:hypothetical protein
MAMPQKVTIWKPSLFALLILHLHKVQKNIEIYVEQYRLAPGMMAIYTGRST